MSWMVGRFEGSSVLIFWTSSGQGCRNLDEIILDSRSRKIWNLFLGLDSRRNLISRIISRHNAFSIMHILVENKAKRHLIMSLGE